MTRSKYPSKLFTTKWIRRNSQSTGQLFRCWLEEHIDTRSSRQQIEEQSRFYSRHISNFLRSTCTSHSRTASYLVNYSQSVSFYSDQFNRYTPILLYFHDCLRIRCGSNPLCGGVGKGGLKNDSLRYSWLQCKYGACIRLTLMCNNTHPLQGALQRTLGSQCTRTSTRNRSNKTATGKDSHLQH